MTIPLSRLLTLALLPFPMSGCGSEYDAATFPESKAVARSPEPFPSAPPEVPPAPSEGMMGSGMMGMGSGMVGTAGALPIMVQERGEAPAADSAPAPGVTRRVIYDATLDLNVDKLDPAAARVGELVAASGGYIAEENKTGSPGSNRSQFWRLRVPVDRFDGFVESVKALGELVQFNRKSQDVTEEFYDVEANVKNKTVQEQTLQKILEERSGKLEDVLKVEVELSRVRGEIERLQGRLRVLEALSSLATLTLTIREIDRFEPPAPVVADFSTQIIRTWKDSLTQLVDVGKALVLFLVAQAVWLPFWIVGLVIAWVGLRRLFARLRPLFTPAAVTPPPASPTEG